MKRLSLLFVVCLSVTSAHAEPLIVDRGARLQSTEGHVEPRLHELAATEGSAGVLRAMAAVEDGSLDLLNRQRLIDDALLSLSVTEPDAAARRFVASFLGEQPSVFVRMTDEHPDMVVPLYDLSASAAFTLRTWDQRVAKRIVADELRRGSWLPSRLNRPDSGLSAAVWRRGTAMAFSEMDIDALVNLRDALYSAQETGESLGEVALIAATRLKDRDLLQATVAYAQQHIALRALLETRVLAPSDALQVLAVARQRDDVASAAVIQLASFAPSEPAATTQLFELLGHETLGGAAALALARAETPQSLVAIRGIVLGDGETLAKLRAALALRLSGSDEAKSLAGELRDAAGLDDRLRGALR